MGYGIITILKLLMGLAGLGLALAYFIAGITNRDRQKIRKGIKIFLLTFLLFILITVVEVIVILRNK